MVRFFSYNYNTMMEKIQSKFEIVELKKNMEFPIATVDADDPIHAMSKIVPSHITLLKTRRIYHEKTDTRNAIVTFLDKDKQQERTFLAREIKQKIKETILKESSLFGWIDPNGKFHSVDSTWHGDFAKTELDKLGIKYSEDEIIYEFTKLGWIRVSGSAFTSYKLTQKKKDFIFMFAKDHNMKYIWVDEIDDGLNSHGKLVGEEPEKLYEQREQSIKLYHGTSSIYANLIMTNGFPMHTDFTPDIKVAKWYAKSKVKEKGGIPVIFEIIVPEHYIDYNIISWDRVENKKDISPNLIKLYEYHQQWSKSPTWNKKAFTVPEDQDCPDDMTRTNDGYCQNDDIDSMEDNTLQEIVEKCR